MACNYPITLLREGRHQLVPCGKCIECIKRKRADWSFRLLQETKNSKKSTFLTLTYNDENLPKSRELEKKTLQKYFKRVRSTQKNLKYYAVGEYGSINLRPHYHAIVFNVDNSDLCDKWTRTDDTKEPLGFVRCDEVNEARIHYVTGYVISKYGEIDEKTGKAKGWTADTVRPFSIMSKGLGKIYLKHATKFHKSNFTTEAVKEGGIKQNLPRYYRDKIFNEEERRSLAIINQEKHKEYQLEPHYEFEKRQYNKIIVQKQIKKKKL